MIALFGARLDDFAIQGADGGYFRAKRPLTVAVVERHLKGEETIGGYVLDKDGRGRWCCIDLDALEREWLDQLHRAAIDLGLRANALLREFSGSKGYHLWVFTELTPGVDLARMGEIIREKSKVPQTDPRYLHPSGQPRQLIEVYPKTTDLNTTDKSMGQLVKWPLGIHRKTGQLATPLEVAGPILPLARAEVETFLGPWKNVRFLLAGGTAEPAKNEKRPFQTYPCTPGLMAATWGEGGRNNVLFLIAKRLRVAGYSGDETLNQLVPWNATNLIPPLSEREVRTTVRSSANYTAMDCLNPDVVPFCSEHCPIYHLSHPTAVKPSNPVTGERPGPKLKVMVSEPPIYILPMAKGHIKLSAAELLDWEKVRIAAAEQLHEDLPRRRPADWDRERNSMFQDLEVMAAPPEVSLPGVVRNLLKAWLSRATDDPVQVERHNVWLDEEQSLYVFQGADFVRWVVNIERGAPRTLPWEVVKEVGGQQMTRSLPGSEDEVDVWVVPVR